MGSWFALGLVIVAALVLLARGDSGMIAGLTSSEFARLIALLAILIFLSGSLFGGYKGRVGRAIRDGAMWALFALVLVTGYAYKDELLPYAERFFGELLPGTPVAVQSDRPGEQAVRIRRQIDGQFVAKTNVGGVTVNMIVDTGASTVVLTPEDARRLGINLAALRYTVPVRTANGTSMAARFRLNRISIGSVQIHNVDALIAKPGALHHSLLGMSFLSRLRSYEFSGDFLTMRG